MNFNLKNLIALIMLFFVFGFSNTAWMREGDEVITDEFNNPEIMIEPDLTWEDIEASRQQLKVYHSGFMAVRDEFFADQSAGNKTRYHKAGQDWATHLLEANLQYIEYIQVDLYNSLVDNSNLNPNWLDADRDSLLAFQDQINESKDYVVLRSIMEDYNKVWQGILLKINHITAQVYLNEVIYLTEDARIIYDNLNSQKERVEQILKRVQVDLDLSGFEQVFTTYSDKLISIETTLDKIKVDLDDSQDLIVFTTEDEDWQELVEQEVAVRNELKTLSTLQENSIVQFVNILNTAVDLDIN